MFITIIITVVVITISHWTLVRHSEDRAIPWLFALLLLIGMAITIPTSLHKQIPSPVDIFTFIFQPISKVIYSLLNM